MNERSILSSRTRGALCLITPALSRRIEPPAEHLFHPPVFVVFPLVTHETHTDEVAIGELPLNARQSMQFQYDFGANWRFDVQLETIESEGTKISEPTIVESRGEAPAEYKSENEW